MGAAARPSSLSNSAWHPCRDRPCPQALRARRNPARQGIVSSGNAIAIRQEVRHARGQKCDMSLTGRRCSRSGETRLRCCPGGQREETGRSRAQAAHRGASSHRVGLRIGKASGQAAAAAAGQTGDPIQAAARPSGGAATTRSWVTGSKTAVSLPSQSTPPDTVARPCRDCLYPRVPLPSSGCPPDPRYSRQTPPLCKPASIAPPSPGHAPRAHHAREKVSACRRLPS
jgi:hypothetical protein